MTTVVFRGNQGSWPDKRLVPREGLEPTHLQEVADFKSAASTISPPRHGGKINRATRFGNQTGARRERSLCAWRVGAHLQGLEATGGFEPPNRGFADLRLNHLATSPRCWQRRSWKLVPRAGFEPTQAIAHGPLKTACLPIPPPRPIIEIYIIP